MNSSRWIKRQKKKICMDCKESLAEIKSIHHHRCDDCWELKKEKQLRRYVNDETNN